MNKEENIGMLIGYWEVEDCLSFFLFTLTLTVTIVNTKQ
jgi:hypothetical protein